VCNKMEVPRGRARAATPPSKRTILLGLLLMGLCWGAVPARAVVGAGPASLSSLFRSWRTAYHYVRFASPLSSPSISFVLYSLHFRFCFA
jgi:hypothetical protein